MMRRLTRISSTAAVFTSTVTGSVAPPNTTATPSLTHTTPVRTFSSNYGDVGNYKPPLRVGGRSGAHRRPAKQNYPKGGPSSLHSAAQAETKLTEQEKQSVTALDSAEAVDGDEELPTQRNYKNNYRDLFKPKKQPIVFTSSFKTDKMKMTDARNSASRANGHDEEDVTKIYSRDEVARIVKKDNKHRTKRTNHYKTGADDVDVLRVLDGDEEDAGEVVTRTYEADDDEIAEGDGSGNDNLVSEDDCKKNELVDNADDKFTEIRNHPFYAELLNRINKNMARYRTDIRSTGRFSAEAVNDCVRPLLQLADYPFTTKELAQLATCVNAAALARSLADRHACSRMHVYRSPDTDLLLDWSVEDFLRRRYESVHLSWEPMDVVCRRFGWTGEEVSDRDLLLYFSEFSEFIELAELEFGANGKPKAVPITNPVERAEKAPISASRLLIRRVPDGETEPSITEAIRLMGAPAMNSRERKGGNNRHHGKNAESVSEMFTAVERAADEVDGDEATKLQHGIDSVRSLKQATHPGGRTVNEFAIGKRKGSPTAAKVVVADLEDDIADGDDDGGASRSFPTRYDPDAFESLSNAFHKTKVEIAMLRRRLLSTDSPAKSGPMQVRLANQRRELSRLNSELRHMSMLRQQQQVETEEGKDEDDVEYKEGFAIPRVRPQYMEAPEADSKNGQAAVNANDDDDIDISEELQEYDETYRPRSKDTTAAGEEAEADVAEEEDISEFSFRRKPSRNVPPSKLTHHANRASRGNNLTDDFNELAEADDFDADEFVASGHMIKKSKQQQKSAADAEKEMDELNADVEAAAEGASGKEADNEKRTTSRSPSPGKGGNVPPRPQYMNAPERDVDEIVESAAAGEEEDDLDISAAIAEYEADLHRPRDADSYTEWHSSRDSRRQPSPVVESEAKAQASLHVERKAKSYLEEDEGAIAEAEVEDVEADHAPALRHKAKAADPRAVEEEEDDNEATSLSRCEELAMVVEKASKAVNGARQALEKLQEEKEAAEATFAKQLERASERVDELESELATALHNHREAVEAEAREAAEAKAHAVEQELEAQRQRRTAEVAKQREQARLAQLEAQKAVERQRKVEQEALAKEKELEMKLAKVRAQLRAVEEHTAAAAASAEEEEWSEPREEHHAVDEPTSEGAQTVAAVAADTAADSPIVKPADAAAKPPLQTANSNAASGFMCSPEQYDGLHLAADRLRTEISALEEQMEEAGDEDDETLMAVLAESRADLEELDDCITSVQQNASWAAARDTKREQEKRTNAHSTDTEAQQLQAEIDNHRFQIGLLEKRLHHATQRNVSNKLEQGIIAARREIGRLRREQDRLRREGRDTFGLPASVSIAETLAGEGQNREKKLREAEAAMRASTDEDSNGSASNGENTSAAEAANSLAAEEAMETGAIGATEFSAHDETDTTKADGQDALNRDDRSSSPAAANINLSRTNADPEAHRLHLRLESMLQDIQQLQDNIAVQERTTDYDDEETESVLVEMKKKLGQLLSLRNAVQQRLAEGGSGDRGQVPLVTPPRAAPALVADYIPTGRLASTRVNGPNGTSVRFGSPAAKKIRKVARNQRR